MYKQGPDNRVPDALSRCPHDHANPQYAISTCVPSWTSAIIQGYDRDEGTQSILSKLAIYSSAVPHFTLQEGILRYKSRNWLSYNKALQAQIMSALHDSPSGGHSGFPVTYRRIKQLFAWKAMKSNIKYFVASCPPATPSCKFSEANQSNLIDPSTPAFFNHCQSHRPLGRSFQWTSSTAYLSLKVNHVCWWS